MGFIQDEAIFTTFNICMNCSPALIADCPTVIYVKNFKSFVFGENVLVNALYVTEVSDEILYVFSEETIQFTKDKLHQCFICSDLLYTVVVDP